MNWFRIFFLGFLLIPFAEIYLLVKIGSLAGALPTVLLVVATAVLGAYLLRVQGFSTWRRLQESLARGEIPAVEVIEGPILLVGGALLLTPGFITDVVGLLCLLPQTRRRLAGYLLENHLRGRIAVSSGTAAYDGGRTFDGEYEREK